MRPTTLIENYIKRLFCIICPCWLKPISNNDQAALKSVTHLKMAKSYTTMPQNLANFTKIQSIILLLNINQAYFLGCKVNNAKKQIYCPPWATKISWEFPKKKWLTCNLDTTIWVAPFVSCFGCRAFEVAPAKINFTKHSQYNLKPDCFEEVKNVQIV